MMKTILHLDNSFYCRFKANKFDGVDGGLVDYINPSALNLYFFHRLPEEKDEGI